MTTEKGEISSSRFQAIPKEQLLDWATAVTTITKKADTPELRENMRELERFLWAMYQAGGRK